MLEYKKDAGKIEELINEYLKETDSKYLRCKTGIRYELDLRGRGEYWIYELFLRSPELQIGSIFYWPSDKKIEVNREVLCDPRTLTLREDYRKRIEDDLQALVKIPESLFLKRYKKWRIL
jgi:hypothetical protein